MIKQKNRWYNIKQTNKQTNKQKIDDTKLIPILEGDTKVKEGKGLKILTLDKLLTGLPVLLAQIKARNNLRKLKSEIRQIMYLLYQHNKINKKLFNDSINSLWQWECILEIKAL